MSSMILSLFEEGAKHLKNAYNESKLSHIINSCHDFFSHSWEDSKILAFLRGTDSEKTKNTVFHKIMSTAYSVWDFVRKKLGGAIGAAIEKSIILSSVRAFTHSALALNTKFMGLLLLSWTLSYEVTARVISPFAIFAGIVGIILVLMNYNVTDFFAESRFAKFGLSVIGFTEVNWGFYKKESTGSKAALCMAVLVGAVMGILPIRLAVLVPIAIVGFASVMMYAILGVFAATLAAPFVPTMILAGICLLTFLSLAVMAITKEDFRWKLDNTGLLLKLFLVIMFISSLLSFAVTKSLMVWAMYLVFVGFYLVIINTVKTKEQLFALLKVFVIAGFFVSLYGVLQYVFGWDTTNAWIDEEMFEQATMRAYSTMENPNVLGEYLLLIIPISAVFMLKGSFKKLETWFFAATLAISVLCLVFTQSRGCWLGLILAAAVFITFYNGRLWALLPIVFLALPFIIPDSMVDRMMSVGNLEDSSTSYRVFIWLGTLRMMKDFWLGGIGMGEGAFRSVYPFYSYHAVIAPHSHNTFLQLLVEGGIVALLVFLVTMVVFLASLSKSYRAYGKKSKESLVALAIGSGVCGFLLQSMFDYTFYNYRMMAMFFMFMAFGSLLALIKEEKTK